MTEDEQSTLRSAVWLTPSSLFLIPRCPPLRPLSLGSLVLAERMGIQWRWDDLGSRAEMAAKWLWAHSGDLDQMLWTLFTDEWRKGVERWEFHPQLSSWAVDVEAYCRRALAQADAVWIKCRPRERQAGVKREIPPADILAPDQRAMILTEVARSMPGIPEQDLIWKTPFARLLAYYHAARWTDAGIWTVGIKAEDAEESRDIEDQWEKLRAASMGAVSGAGAMQSAIDQLDQLDRWLDDAQTV